MVPTAHILGITCALILTTGTWRDAQNIAFLKVDAMIIYYITGIIHGIEEKTSKLLVEEDPRPMSSKNQ